MKNKKTKTCGVVMTALAMFAMGAVVITSPTLAVHAGSENLDSKGKFYTDYDTFAEAKKAAQDLNLRLSEEGNSLLKNTDKSLPMAEGSKLSVFGVTSDNLTGGGTDTVADSLRAAGFRVNPTLENFYAQDDSPIGSENLKFTGAVDSSLSVYREAAVMVISRTGGEGADLATVTNETVKSSDQHAHLFADASGKHKHYLMLTDSEESLLTYIESHFNTVHIIINSSHILEVGALKDDAKVKSILWIGRPGETGIGAVGEIYAGKVNPSGGVVDEWERDFTADPTWQNFGNNSQTGSSNLYKYSDGKDAGSNSLPNTFPPMMPGFHGVDYEEGIYLGYRYYETKYAAMAGNDLSNVTAANDWYKANVAYPFGYGLNYTTFSFLAGGLYTDETLTSALGNNVSSSIFASSKDHPAQVKTLYLPVTVTNTGDVAGKKTVQVYVTAPYTQDGVEKSFVTLAGFAKTGIIKPGKSQTVVVKFNVEDFASYDYADKNHNGNKGYELDAGNYVVRVMDSAHFDLATSLSDTTDAYDEVRFTLGGTANLKLDDYSNNVVENLFSSENGIYNAVRTGKNVSDSANMTNLSRADLIGTFPAAPTNADLTFKDSFFADITKWELFDADNTATYASYDTAAKSSEARWTDDFSSIPSTWGQGEDHGKYKLTDVSGIDPQSSEIIASGVFAGKTGAQAWTLFMNSLTWDEMVSLPSNGGWSTVGVDSIGLKTSVDNDSPEDWHSTHLWCDTPTIAATFNVDLAEEEGIIIANLGMLDLGENLTGWYGPGMDTHRSPFSGRNNQYYSQDGLHAGYMASAVVKGAESRGVLCYPKHFALNDQETSRDGELSFSWVNEQAMREIYLKPFQMAQQEGGASGTMTAFARIGDIPAADNYNLLTALTRKQWGWKGYFVTDGYEGDAKSSPMDLMLRSGNDLALGTPTTADILLHYSADGSTYQKGADRTVSGTWDASLRSGKGSVVVGTAKTQSDMQYFLLRNTAQRMLFQFANSIKTVNGTKLEQYAGKALAVSTQGTALSNVSVAVEGSLLNGASTVYSIEKGALPAGVTLSNDGSIKGTPTVSGDFTFTVKVVADNWQQGTADFTWHIDSAFSWDGDPLDKASVGKAFVGNIDSSTITTANYTSVEYTLSQGALPAGLTLSKEGEISGTPTVKGTYSFTIDVAASKTSAGMGPFPMTTVSHYAYSTTITVGEDAVPGEDYGKEIAKLNDELATARTIGIVGISVGSVSLLTVAVALLIKLINKHI